jgi:hypothetical protein
VIRAGWATAAGDALWHSFAVVDDGAEPTLSRCTTVTLPVADVDRLVAVPRGRPCFACLIAATEPLPRVGRMGSVS